MAQEAMFLFEPDGTTKKELATQYGNLIKRIQADAVSVSLKNTRYVNEPIKGGTVEVERIAVSRSQNYGTARSNGEGSKIKIQTVSVKIDTDKEIVEEIRYKDLVANKLGQRLANRREDHAATVVEDLDLAYFSKLESAATDVSSQLPSGGTLEEKLSKLINIAQAVENDFVRKVPRSVLRITLKPEFYDKLMVYKDQVTNPLGQSYIDFHKVQVYEAPRQSVDAVIQVQGSVAQPLIMVPYNVYKIPLSPDFAVGLFYFFGTEAVMPDLIFKATLASA